MAPNKGKSAFGPTDKNVALERILGNTVESNNAWSINPITDEIAYIAGNVVVIYHPDTHKQVRFLRHTKTVTTVQYSPDGRFLAVGEKGKNPAVHLWKVGNTSNTRKPFPVARLTTTFPFGVLSCVFTDSGGYILATSEREDMACVFEVSAHLRRRMDAAPAEVAPLCSQPTKNKILSCTYFAQQKVFVTAGCAHLKTWSLERPSAPVENRRFSRSARLSDAGDASKELRGPVTVSVSSASLGTTYRTATFVEVACWDDKCYAVTADGHLCRLAMTVQNGRTRLTLEKAKNLKIASVHALSVNARYIIVGCGEGTVRVIDRDTLEYLGATPKPNALGQECAGASPSTEEGAVYPDVLACLLTASSQHLYTLYSDGCFTSWNLTDFPRVTANFSEYAHKQCIWDMHLLPQPSTEGKDALVTCSADNTIRLWQIQTSGAATETPFLGATLDGIIHTDSQFQCLRQGATNTPLGIRCMALSADGKHLASGDRQGNIRVHELPSLAQIDFKEAHESEVLSLSYTPAEASVPLLASASRDRLIHLFSSQGKGDELYPHVDALEDHTSAITAVQFALTEDKELRLISCSADKSVIFRSLQLHSTGDEDSVEIRRFANAVTAGAPYDICGDAATQSILVGGKEKKLTRYHIATGKAHGDPVPTVRESENVIKLFMHESGKYVLASSTDKALRLYQCDAQGKPTTDKENMTSNRTVSSSSTSSATARCLFSAYGPSFITAACFSRCSSKVYAASADGTVFVWRLPTALVQKLTQGLAPSLPTPTDTQTEPLTSSASPTTKSSLDKPAPVAVQEVQQPTAPSTWTKSDELQDSLISRLGLKPQVKDEFNFQAIFAKPEDAATQALRRLTIEPSKEGDASVTDQVALSVALSSVSDDEKFFDFDHFAEIALSPADCSRLSLSRAFRSSSPSTDSKLSNSAKKTKSARLRKRSQSKQGAEESASTPMQAPPPVTAARATSIQMVASPEPSEEEQPLKDLTEPVSQEEEDDTVLMELSGSAEEKESSPAASEETDLPESDQDSSRDERDEEPSPLEPSPSPSSCVAAGEESKEEDEQMQEDGSMVDGAPEEVDALDEHEEEQCQDDKAESYDLVLRHQAAMNLLQNACENALQLYDDAHYEYDLVSQEDTQSAFLPVYEQILDDYEQVFHRVGERLRQMPHSNPTSSSNSLHQFSGMLRQLASMIEEKRIVS